MQEESGDLFEGYTANELAFMYIAEVMDDAEYADKWASVRDGTYGVDWDAILEFLEGLFELLIKFLPFLL
jgi:hypothetical protein